MIKLLVNSFGRTTLTIVVLIWLVAIVDLLLPMVDFNHYGIRPRQMSGLVGILFSPFLHVGLNHLLSNTVSLLGAALLVRMSLGTNSLPIVMLLGTLGAGLGVWLFSTAGIVVGASGMIYALIGLLFALAFFRPSIRTWFSAVIALMLFGGVLLSFFNVVSYVSWSAHFWGFLTGIVTAFLLQKLEKADPR